MKCVACAIKHSEVNEAEYNFEGNSLCHKHLLEFFRSRMQTVATFLRRS